MDSKPFSKTVKPLQSDKFAGKYKIHLIEKIELFKNELETAEVLKKVFSSMVQNLIVSRYLNDETLVSNTNDATLEAILKYSNHPSIIAIRNKCKDKGSLKFI